MPCQPCIVRLQTLSARQVQRTFPQLASGQLHSPQQGQRLRMIALQQQQGFQILLRSAQITQLQTTPCPVKSQAWANAIDSKCLVKVNQSFRPMGLIHLLQCQIK
jgi:hypothetical protein